MSGKQLAGKQSTVVAKASATSSFIKAPHDMLYLLHNYKQRWAALRYTSFNKPIIGVFIENSVQSTEFFATADFIPPTTITHVDEHIILLANVNPCTSCQFMHIYTQSV